MCGIAGSWRHDRPQGGLERLEGQARAMAASLRHRGPDAQSIWLDADRGLALAHARLSVIDLSETGDQPMISACGRYVIAYNGECYDTQDLREELTAKGTLFRGHSDTEVILESCALFGVEATLPRLNGMFAFALWDRRDKTLILARDRFGIKPLYYTTGSHIAFGSEIKAILAGLDHRPEIDEEARAAYLHFAYVPAPRSIWKSIRKLPAGCLIRFDEDRRDGRLEQWWDLRGVVRQGLTQPMNLSPQEAEDALDSLLRRAVGGCMVADVPLGAFLSGGIDSSVVVAQMQAQSSRAVKTFTIGLGEYGYDESADARAVARHLGTDHHDLIVTPEQAIETIPSLPHWYDEPFADSSQIPTFLVSRLARQQVTVSLSGDGGDEFFAGYNRYNWAERIWSMAAKTPVPLRRLGSWGIRSIPSRWWQILEGLPKAPRLLEIKAAKIAGLLGVEDANGVYRFLASSRLSPIDLTGREIIDGPLWDQSLSRDIPPLVERMQYLDAISYLPDDILTKVDRASMAVSLEARVPLLDHRLAEFAFSLPRPLRSHNGIGKILLRRVLARYVPPSLFDRPKMGFGIPIGAWLRGALRPWAEELLSEHALRASGLNPAPARALWHRHCAGKGDHSADLWILLMYQAWHQRWISNRP